ncbi:MAG: hypothetical protein IJ795_02620 [Bacteroidales bacterium]|nr:hypothetical protein [Bacteroidales bacterium]
MNTNSKFNQSDYVSPQCEQIIVSLENGLLAGSDPIQSVNSFKINKFDNPQDDDDNWF